MKWKAAILLIVGVPSIFAIGYYYGVSNSSFELTKTRQELQKAQVSVSDVYQKGLKDANVLVEQAYQSGLVEGRVQNKIQEAWTLEDLYKYAHEFVATYDLVDRGDNYHYYVATIVDEKGNINQYVLRVELNTFQKKMYELLKRAVSRQPPPQLEEKNKPLD